MSDDSLPIQSTAQDERIAELETAARYAIRILKAVRQPALQWDAMVGGQIAFVLTRLQQAVPDDEAVIPAVAAARPGRPAG